MGAVVIVWPVVIGAVVIVRPVVIMLREPHFHINVDFNFHSRMRVVVVTSAVVMRPVMICTIVVPRPVVGIVLLSKSTGDQSRSKGNQLHHGVDGSRPMGCEC